jgi:Tfp pilus assembly protein PilZ
MYEVAVRNNRDVPIRIEVFDQVPISNSNDISVTADELSGSEKNIETGEVVWNMSIAPAGVQSKQLGYTVKYPKNMNVSVSRYRWRERYKF